MKILSVKSVSQLIKLHGIEEFLHDLILALRRDFSKWEQFTKIPRPAMHMPGGVIELMPICDNEQYYTYKYITCFPKNPLTGQISVIGTGQIADANTGYPLMISEMTILTALRTAATSALAIDLMSRRNSRVLAIIGTGAQSEFQVLATAQVRDITEVRYFDLDEKAMDKFEKNILRQAQDKFTKLKLTRCKNTEEAVLNADIISVCTASKKRVVVVKDAWVKKGAHINAIGGDTPGKTELEKKTLQRSRIVVEYFDQSIVEGEIQQLSEKQARKQIVAYLYELVMGAKKARVSDNDITLFDSVGVALEDYSVLRLAYELSHKYKIGEDLAMIPELKDPKNLFSALL